MLLYAEGAELSRFINPKLVISWAVVIGLPINAVVTYITLPSNYLEVPLMYWQSLLFLGLFSMYIGFFFWYEGLSMGGISRVSQVQLTQPFITLIFANLVLSEKLEAINFIFAALVVASVFLGKQMLVKRT